MATFCPSDGSALAPHVLEKEREYYTTKQRLGKHSRSDTEYESTQPLKKLQHTSASLDLTPLLTNFSTLGIPFPVYNGALANRKQVSVQVFARPGQAWNHCQMNCLSIYSVIFLDKS